MYFKLENTTKEGLIETKATTLNRKQERTPGATDKSRCIADIRKFSKQLSTSVNYRKATLSLCEETQKLLKASQVILLMESDAHQALEVERLGGLSLTGKPPRLELNDKLTELVKNKKQPIEIDKSSPYQHVVDQSEFLKALKGSFACRLIVKLTFNGQVIGALLFGAPIGVTIRSVYARQVLAELGERAGVTLRHARLLRSLKRESMEKDLLLDIGRKINSTLNLDELLNLILDSLQQVVHYDKATIFLTDHRTKIIGKIARRGPQNVPENMLLLKVVEGLCAWVLNYKEPVVVEDVTKDLRYYALYGDTKSEMDIPIISRDMVLGVFNLESNSLSAFSRRDRRLVQALAGQAAIAIENANLLREMLEKKELERELKIARRFQRALLPRNLPDIEGYEFAAINVPSKTVGGDIYDFIQFSDGRIGISIGDVAGKGTPGAIIMAMLFSTYRGIVRRKIPVNKMMYDLNNLLKKRISSSNFITFFYGELMPATGEFIYSNAGHCTPILLRHNDQVERLQEGGLVLGFLPDSKYDLGRTVLQPGDLLFLFTDGVTEAMPANREEIFDEARLLSLLRENKNAPAMALLRKIYHKVKAYTKAAQLQDDFTAVAIKVQKNS